MRFIANIDLWNFSLQLLEHLCVMYTLISLYSQFFSMRILEQSPAAKKNGSGILFFTVLAAVSMFLPLESYADGVILDLRLALVMLASIHLGIKKGAVVALLVSALRWGIGGLGAVWWTAGAFMYGPLAVLVVRRFASRRMGMLAAASVNTAIYLALLAALSYFFGWFEQLSPYTSFENFKTIAFAKFVCNGLAVIILDVALLKLLSLERKYSSLRNQADIDHKTGLFNYRKITEHLGKAVAKLDKPAAILMIDVDHFKQYNDAYGHQAGDVALKHIADIIGKCIGNSGFVGRYGGEEFIVVLPGMAKWEAVVISEELRDAVAQAEFPGRPVTVSVGLAYCTEQTDEKSLIAAADEALYRAKNYGRNCVQY